MILIISSSVPISTTSSNYFIFFFFFCFPKLSSFFSFSNFYNFSSCEIMLSLRILPGTWSNMVEVRLFLIDILFHERNFHYIFSEPKNMKKMIPKIKFVLFKEFQTSAGSRYLFFRYCKQQTHSCVKEEK